MAKRPARRFFLQNPSKSIYKCSLDSEFWRQSQANSPPRFWQFFIAPVLDYHGSSPLVVKRAGFNFPAFSTEFSSSWDLCHRDHLQTGQTAEVSGESSRARGQLLLRLHGKHMKTCTSEVHHVFVLSLFAFPCRIKTSRTSCSSHESNCESTSQDQFISWLHGVCACLCWPGTSRGDQEAGARGTGKGHGDKVSLSMPQGGEDLEYLGIPDLARPAQPQNIILQYIQYTCHSDQDFPSCFAAFAVRSRNFQRKRH